MIDYFYTIEKVLADNITVLRELAEELEEWEPEIEYIEYEKGTS